jgi:hypothetical protein
VKKFGQIEFYCYWSIDVRQLSIMGSSVRNGFGLPPIILFCPVRLARPIVVLSIPSDDPFILFSFAPMTFGFDPKV